MKEAALILGIGVAYFIFISVTGLYLPCPIRTITGLKCPGCGISHMFMHLGHLKFKAAFQDNPFIFTLLPFAIPYGILREYKYIKTGQITYSKAEIRLLILLLIAALAFGFLRNLDL